MRRWAETAEQVRATRRTLGEGRARGETTCARWTMPTSRRRRSSWPVAPSLSATSARPVSAGRPSRASCEAVAGAEDGALTSAPTTARPTWAPPSASCFAEAGHEPSADAAATDPGRGRGRLPGRSLRPAAAKPSGTSWPGCCGVPTRSRPATWWPSSAASCASACAEGHLEAAIAAAFGRDLAAVAVGRHAHRGHRADGRSWPATTRSGPRACTLFHPLKSMLASPVGRRGGGAGPHGPAGLGGGQVRRHPRPAPQGGPPRSASSAGTSTTSPASSRKSCERPQELPWDGILDGEILAWQDGAALPFLRAAVATGSQGAVAGHPGSGCRSSTWPSTSWRWATGGASPVEPLLRLPLRERRARLEALGLDRHARLRAGRPRRTPPTPTSWRASSTRPRRAATRAS